MLSLLQNHECMSPEPAQSEGLPKVSSGHTSLPRDQSQESSGIRLRLGIMRTHQGQDRKVEEKEMFALELLRQKRVQGHLPCTPPTPSSN